MATPVYYTGDTWPPLTGTAKKADGTTVDLSLADSLRCIAKPQGASPSITGSANKGTPVTLDQAPAGTDGNDGKWEYVWALDDLSAADTYVPELEVTWDASSTPPKIETFRDDSQTFIVKTANG